MMDDARTTLTITEAAAYLNLTETQFRGAVKRGDLPPPIIYGYPRRWSKLQIDWALQGRRPVDQRPADQTDPLMERINALQITVRSRS